MPNFYSRSIRGKLILLFTGTASLTVLLACCSLWVYSLLNYRAALNSQEVATAQLIADSSGAALLFRDVPAATETLLVLRADSRIHSACLYDKHAALIAHYSPTGLTAHCPAAETTASSFSRSLLTIVKSIEVKGENVGFLYLEVGLTEMYAGLNRLAIAGFCVLLLTTLFALALSSVLQRVISRPILHLTAIATQVSTGDDYLVRAKHISNDETGVLIDQFNVMMDHLEERETELRHAHDSLEEKVRERTLDLRNEILEREAIQHDLGIAKLFAEESNRAKSAFLANMSHELRTPLNAIIGYSEMLHEEAAQAGIPTMSEDLEKVLLSAHHLLSLISDILDISKIEAGQMKLYPELVSPPEVMEDIIATTQILARSNGNRIVVEKPVWRGAMVVDTLRFRQCLLNLVGNACKFTKDGTISIAVHQEMNEGSSWVRWAISDTGVGIPQEEQSKLFQTFSQGDSSTTRKHGGSGLGLAISQQLCNAMGGYITVSSTFGRGSTFTISVPGEVGSVA